MLPIRLDCKLRSSLLSCLFTPNFPPVIHIRWSEFINSKLRLIGKECRLLAQSIDWWQLTTAQWCSYALDYCEADNCAKQSSFGSHDRINLHPTSITKDGYSWVLNGKVACLLLGPLCMSGGIQVKSFGREQGHFRWCTQQPLIMMRKFSRSLTACYDCAQWIWTVNRCKTVC